ncbi:hypothetical protein QVZ41_06685 [Wenyingzhuangia sp. chi5]|uniref:Sensor of ECF-type sigma factor n=1 Tax=Wenyingzhuangia gilva TaxID=3057677 RepID=A0ABT8VRD9_9FLAO|nr:hypothetical protein [Wenyingzhuangia sp. chi5]MDO3694529.1 hypothetical protein [Wenyingzhuangia sp. chi5]
MKKQFTLLLFFLFMSVSFFGQGNDENSREKIRSAKVSFISNEISLTPEQAEKFWPIYNSFRDSMYKLYGEKHNIERRVDFNKVTEKEAKILVQKIQDKEVQINQAKTNYIKELSKILAYKQILKLNYAEHKFKKTLLERIKKEN